MGFSASDVVPFTQARSHLSELADQAKAGAEKIIIQRRYGTPANPPLRVYSLDLSA